MPKYVKPNGTEIEINERSEAYAKTLGWVKKKGRPASKPKSSKPKAD